MAKKIIKFDQKSDFYLTTGLNYLDNGDLLKALPMFFLALEKNVDIETLFCISDTYVQMGLYDYSNSMLFEILLIDPNNSEAGLEIAQNFHSLGLTFKELYYIGKYSDSEDANEIAEWLEQRIESNSFSLVHPMSRRDFEFNKHSVEQYISKGYFGLAREILTEMNEYYPRDIFVLNNFSKSYLLEEEYEKAKYWAEQALEINRDDIFAKCNLGIALMMTEETENADKIVREIAMSKTEKSDEVKQLAKFFCFIGEHDNIVHWCQKALKENPYDIDYLVYFAIASYNIGEYKSAKETFLKLLTLAISPIVVKYFLKQIDIAMESNEKKKKLEYTFDVPETERKKLLKKIKNMDPVNILEDENKCDLVSWGLRLDDEELGEFIFDLVLKGDPKSYHEYLQKILISDSDPRLKAQALLRLFLDGKRTNIFMTKDDFFVNVVRPNKLPPADVRLGFLHACATLNAFMLDMGDYSKIYNAACDLSQRLKSKGFFASESQSKLFAALIVRNAQSDLCDDKTLTELFQIDYRLLTIASESLYTD